MKKKLILNSQFSILNYIVVILLACFSACNDNNKAVAFPEPPVYDMTGFAKGADVSWLTQMENEGCLFYDSIGRPMDCMTLLRNLGMNSIRLRAWVNPAGGWCDKNDVLIKAWRANNLNMRVMIDFHYSDTWADPGNQTKPAAWTALNFDGLKSAVSVYTEDVLTNLKTYGITPEWVQIGNETSDGMLWEDGRASTNMKNYAALTTAGYDAVKAIFPDTKVIVHLPDGNKNSTYRWLFDGLKNNGGKWDVIGMSLYPDTTNWQTMNTQCLANIADMISRYGSDVMICETGMQWDQPETSKAFLTDLIAKTKAVPDNKCLGVFYWEPEGYANWSGYAMSAFDNTGRPTAALDAFK